MAEGGDDPPSSALSRVYRAVAAGQSVPQVLRVIDEYPPELRKAAVNAVTDGETALKAAHRLRRGDLVGALLERDADAAALFEGGEATTALALCIAHGQAGSVRVLVREKGVDPNAPVPVYALDGHHGYYVFTDTPVRPAALCVAPPPLPPPAGQRYYCYARAGPPQLDCLQVLVEAGADVNLGPGPGALSECLAPLHCLGEVANDHAEAVLARLLELGADPNARDAWGMTPLMRFVISVQHQNPGVDPGYDPDHLLPCLRRLLDAGAQAAGVFDHEGGSALSLALGNFFFSSLHFLTTEGGVDDDERHPVTGATALIRSIPKVLRTANQGFLGTQDAFIEEGWGDVDAEDNEGRSALTACLALGPESYNSRQLTKLLLQRGAQVDRANRHGVTPLMVALRAGWQLDDGSDEDDGDGEEGAGGGGGGAGGAGGTPLVRILRGTSAEMRRAVCLADQSSAVDALAWCKRDFLQSNPGAAVQWSESDKVVLAELLAARAPVLEENAAIVLPPVLERGLPLAGFRSEIELAFRRRPSNRWRGEDEIVQLAFDFVELREAEEGVRRREARVRELEEECKALGIGTEDSDEEEASGEEAEASGETASGGGSGAGEPPASSESGGDDDEEQVTSGEGGGNVEKENEEMGTGSERASAGEGEGGGGDDGRGG